MQNNKLLNNKLQVFNNLRKFKRKFNNNYRKVKIN